MVHHGQAAARPARPTEGVVSDDGQRLIGGTPHHGAPEHDVTDIVQGPLGAGEAPLDDRDVAAANGASGDHHGGADASAQAVPCTQPLTSVAEVR